MVTLFHLAGLVFVLISLFVAFVTGRCIDMNDLRNDMFAFIICNLVLVIVLCFAGLTFIDSCAMILIVNTFGYLYESTTNQLKEGLL